MSDKLLHTVIRYRRKFNFIKRILGLVFLVLKILEKLKDLIG